jgi:putative phosphoesterase
METEPRDPGYCLYLAERALDLLPQVRNEIDGVRKSEDVECVHRMRVASRRLRAVLSLSAGCVGRKELRRWRQEIRSLTRALGAARDADVQVDHLLSYAARLPGGRGAESPGFAAGWPPAGMIPGSPESTAIEAPATAPPTLFPAFRAWLRRIGVTKDRSRTLEETLPQPDAGPPGQQGIECLLLRLGQQREGLQPAVLAALDRLEASDVLEEMAERFRTIEVRARREGALSRSAPVYDAAHLNVQLRCDELLGHAPALRDPARSDEHHAMRIAAKQLRYTLETFAPLYDGLKAELKAIKRLQETLGQLHDCDVWIVQLPQFLEEERNRTFAYFGHDGFFRFIEPGVRQLLEDRVAEHQRLHAAALSCWEELERDRLIERLIDRLARAGDEARLPPPPLRSIAEGDGTARIALIADVHANLPALEAVIRDAEARGAQAFINAGDLVGYGHQPNEVCHRLAEIGSVDVRGNLDQKVIRTAQKGTTRPGRAGPGSVAWTAAWILPASRAYLEGLPADRRFSLRGTRFLVTHTSPDGRKEGVRPDLDPEDLAGLALSARADCVIVGHTHRPSLQEADQVRFINPGSVGRAWGADGIPRAEYALLQLFPFDLCLISIPYAGPGADRIAPAMIEDAPEKS